MPQHSTLLGMIKEFSRNIGLFALVYLAIYFAFGVFQAVLLPLLFPEQVGFAARFTSYCLLSFVSSSAVVMLVIGIIYPFMLSLHMSLGVTRREHALALLVIGVGLSLVFSLVNGLIHLVFGSFTALSIPTAFVMCLSGYLGGWVIALGFQFRRVTTAILGFIIVVVLSLIVGLTIEQFAPTTLIMHFDADVSLATWVDVFGELILCVCFSAIILAATKHIPIKI
jgi:hypothetical protein